MTETLTIFALVSFTLMAGYMVAQMQHVSRYAAKFLTAINDLIVVNRAILDQMKAPIELPPDAMKAGAYQVHDDGRMEHLTAGTGTGMPPRTNGRRI